MAPMTAIDQAHRCAQDVRPNRMPARLSAQFASIGAACWPQRLSGRTAAAPGQSPAAGTLLGVRRAPPQRSTARRTCPCGRCPRVRPLCARVQARWGERREGQKSPISSLTGAPPKQRAAACRCRLRGDRKSRTRRCRMSSVERRGGAEARGHAAWRLQSASTAPRCAATRQRRDGTGCLADARGNRRRGPRSRRARVTARRVLTAAVLGCDAQRACRYRIWRAAASSVSSVFVVFGTAAAGRVAPAQLRWSGAFKARLAARVAPPDSSPRLRLARHRTRVRAAMCWRVQPAAAPPAQTPRSFRSKRC